MWCMHGLSNFLICILIVGICIVGGGMDILPGPSGQNFLGEPSGGLDSGQGKILHVMFGRLKAGRWGHGGGAVCEWWSEWVGTKKFMHQLHSHSF
jgi:hypothetical protein